MDNRASVPDEDLGHILAGTGAVWRELAGQRLFITGGTGFFGIWLLESIAAANRTLGVGIAATVLSRDPAAFASRFPDLAANPSFDWVTGDVRDFRFPRGRFNQVIHAATAASAALNTSDPGEMFSVIADGTRHVLHFAAQAETRNFLLLSSGAVYGPQPAEMERIPEEYLGGPDPIQSASAYAEGKRAAELLCAIAGRDGIDIKIARGFAFVGPHLPLDAHFAIGNFIRDALAGGAVIVRGDGAPYRSYLHAADAAIWLWRILVDGAPLRPYNVGSDEALTLATLAKEIANRVGNGAVVIAKPPQEAPAQRYIPDIARARRELNLDVRIRLSDAILRTCAWERQSRERMTAQPSDDTP